ncbi:3-deoxy-7-phosphoheptulonate synthase [Chlamydiales bacterium]|nr:3-deoxy-7-phosphoheptulonate synthase [Chlamydiales bacterium]
MLQTLESNILLEEPLIAPSELHSSMPLTMRQREVIQNGRSQLIDIIEGRDKRFVLVVGPCSVHDPFSIKEYGERLLKLQEKVEKHFFIIMRIYLEKPRTLFGWKGYLLDPLLEGKSNPSLGIKMGRHLLQELTDKGIFIATEFLSPLAAPYLSDLITWGSIGARTSASPIHRQLASSLPMPIGFKNSVEGDLETAMNGIQVAKEPQSFLNLGNSGSLSLIHTTGNCHSHLVLRGGTKTGPNYTKKTIDQAYQILKNKNLIPKIMIDCSHENSQKNPNNQPLVFKQVLSNFLEKDSPVFGVMLESYLVGGKQPLKTNHPLTYGQSITDPCISWDETNDLILKATCAF